MCQCVAELPGYRYNPKGSIQYTRHLRLDTHQLTGRYLATPNAYRSTIIERHDKSGQPHQGSARMVDLRRSAAVVLILPKCALNVATSICRVTGPVECCCRYLTASVIRCMVRQPGERVNYVRRVTPLKTRTPDHRGL